MVFERVKNLTLRSKTAGIRIEYRKVLHDGTTCFGQSLIIVGGRVILQLCDFIQT